MSTARHTRDTGRIGFLTLAAVTAIVVAGLASMQPSVSAAATTGYVALDAPARLLDTRAGEPTIDGQFSGQGRSAAGAILELPVGGRAGVPLDATSAVLNVTAVDAASAGFVTVFPCGAPQPTASNLNVVVGQTVPNLVVAKLGTGARICLFTQASVHLVVDVSGYFPGIDAFVPLAAPQRMLDTRAGQPTIDGDGRGGGPVLGGVELPVQISGRGGVPANARTVVLNVTATETTGPGFVTVYPCGQRPLASNLNYAAAATVPNAVVARLDGRGMICLFTQATAQLLVDVSGYLYNDVTVVPLGRPARLLDTRAGETTVDGLFQGDGIRTPGTSVRLTIGGRANVPAGATAVVLNVTATEALAPGFVTVYPNGAARPLASNLNVTAGATVANAVIAKLGPGGTACFYTSTTTHLVVDVSAYLFGDIPAASGGDCTGVASGGPVPGSSTAPTSSTTTPTGDNRPPIIATGGVRGINQRTYPTPPLDGGVGNLRGLCCDLTSLVSDPDGDTLQLRCQVSGTWYDCARLRDPLIGEGTYPVVVEASDGVNPPVLGSFSVSVFNAAWPVFHCSIESVTVNPDGSKTFRNAWAPLHQLTIWPITAADWSTLHETYTVPAGQSVGLLTGPTFGLAVLVNGRPATNDVSNDFPITYGTHGFDTPVGGECDWPL